jgi:hypothetical protein
MIRLMIVKRSIFVLGLFFSLILVVCPGVSMDVLACEKEQSDLELWQHKCEKMLSSLHGIPTDDLAPSLGMMASSIFDAGKFSTNIALIVASEVCGTKDEKYLTLVKCISSQNNDFSIPLSQREMRRTALIGLRVYENVKKQQRKLTELINKMFAYRKEIVTHSYAQMVAHFSQRFHDDLDWGYDHEGDNQKIFNVGIINIRRECDEILKEIENKRLQLLGRIKKISPN